MILSLYSALRMGFFNYLGLTAKLIHRTRTMSDVYGVFLEFTSIMKAKVYLEIKPK